MRNAPVLLLCSFLLLSATAFGQQNQNSNTNRNSNSNGDDTRVEVEQMLELENDSREDEVVLSIPENTREMQIKVYGQISNGRLVVELYDPNGKKEGTFSLSTKGKPGKNAQATGNLTKSLRDPEAGDWIVKILPANVTGDIGIRSAYIQ
jgi:hypothetical protein